MGATLKSLLQRVTNVEKAKELYLISTTRVMMSKLKRKIVLKLMTYLKICVIKLRIFTTIIRFLHDIILGS